MFLALFLSFGLLLAHCQEVEQGLPSSHHIEKTGYNILPVVPFPQLTQMSSTARRSLHVEEFKISSSQGLLDDRVVAALATRYQYYFSRFKTREDVGDGYITEVAVKVEDLDVHELHIGVNESYTIDINPDSQVVALTANTKFGLIRGLETFYQLYNVTDGTFPSVLVHDWPRFAYRGLLLDTSRHYLTLESIFKVIEAMSMNKLNVLHWHIVDDPSFPYVSPAFPDMATAGAYDHNHIYTVGDMLEVISFAEYYGVVIVPEFDTPGHTLSWGKGVPNLLTYCPGVGTFGGDYGPINPMVEENFSFLEKLFSEVTQLFPSLFVHLGGDEVPFNCWAANPDLVAWMKKQGIKDFKALESYYETRLLDIIHGLNHSYIVWEEIFTNGLKIQPETIIHVWKGGWQSTLSKVIQKGYRAIISSPWYLNYITFGRDWKTYYAVEPLNITGTPEQLALVMGGEACMWGEFVDSTNVLSRTFPRSSAVAERLWSSEKVQDLSDMEFRLDKHRCSMCARNIPAETIITRGFCPFEYDGYDY